MCIRDRHYFVAQGFKKLVKKAVETGDLEFGRDSVIVLNGVHPGSIHSVSYTHLDVYKRQSWN